MATSPISAVNTGQKDIQPVFKRVGQTNPNDCAFACVATISSKTLAEVMQVAVSQFGHPEHGPYWVPSEELIAKLLAHFGLVATLYKPVTKGMVDLPDVAIVMVEYREEDELGRHVVFVRDQSNQKQIKEYLIDVANHIDPTLHVRTDFKNLNPAWFIGVHPMKKTSL